MLNNISVKKGINVVIEKTIYSFVVRETDFQCFLYSCCMFCAIDFLLYDLFRPFPSFSFYIPAISLRSVGSSRKKFSTV